MLQRADGARCGVVKAEHPGTVTRSCRPQRPERPASPTSPRWTISRSAGPRVWEETGTYRFDDTADPGRGLLHRHPAADGLGLPPHGLGLRVRADRRHRPLPAHAGVEALLPDGMGRQRAADRAAGADVLRRDVRPLAPLRPRLHAARGARARTTSRSAGPTSLRCATSSPPRTSGRSRTCGGGWGSRSTGAARYATIDDTQPPHQPAHVPAQPGPRRGLHVRGADAVGRRLPDGGGPGRNGGPRAGRRVPPPALRRHRDRDRRDPSWWRPAWRWWPIPTTSATPPTLRLHRAHPALRRGGARRSPIASPSPTRARASP